MNRASCVEIVVIPEGFFLMGSENGQENEMPRHRVWLESFGIGRFPVTNREYKIFVDENQGPLPDFWSDPIFADPDLPVVGVSWDDAKAYCNWLRGRTGKEFGLPSEAEWERASRGGREGALYPWGNEPPWERPYAGYDSRTGGPERVGTNPPNDFGLYDMSEGVHEWCNDYYDAGYYRYSPEKNPQGPSFGLRRSSRGGSWRHRSSANRVCAPGWPARVANTISHPVADRYQA